MAFELNWIFYDLIEGTEQTNGWLVGWLVGQSVDGNQSIWENILESEKNDKEFHKGKTG